MPIPVIQAQFFTDIRATLSKDIDLLLSACLQKIADCESVSHFPSGQSEVYETAEIHLNGVKYRLSTFRINDAHRLFFITHKEIFFPLEVAPFHDIHKAKILHASQSLIDILSAQIKEAILRHEQPSEKQTEESALIPKTRGVVVLDADQESIVHRFLNAARGMILLAPGGTGKTEIAKRLMREMQMGTYVSSSRLLCAEVAESLSDQTNEMMRSIDYASLENSVCAIVAPELLNLENPKNAANFSYFERWYKTYIATALKGQKPKRISPQLLYVEITRVIIQFETQLEKPHLSKVDYLALKDAESVVMREHRAFVYDLFIAYITALENDSAFYEPHLRTYAILKKLIGYKIAHPDLDASDPLNACTIHELIADEVQQSHPFTVRLLFELLNNPKSGSWILMGDFHQSVASFGPRAEEQHRLVLSSVGIELEMIDVARLQRDYRNATLVGGLGNLFLMTENKLWGSRSRNSTYGLEVSESATLGELSIPPDQAAFAQTVRNNPAIAIIVPDESDIAELQAMWGRNVLRISTVGGLEWDRVVLVGFGETESAKEWCHAFSDLSLDDLSIQYARKKGEDARLIPSIPALILHQALNLGVMRARHVLSIVDSNKSFLAVFQKLIAFLHEKYMPSVVEQVEQKPATPLQWIVEVNRYFETDAIETAIDILWSDLVWGSSELAAFAKAIVIDTQSTVISRNIIQQATFLLQSHYFKKFVELEALFAKQKMVCDALLRASILDALQTQSDKKLLSVLDAAMSKYRVPLLASPAPSLFGNPVAAAQVVIPSADSQPVVAAKTTEKNPTMQLRDDLLNNLALLSDFLEKTYSPQVYAYCLFRPGVFQGKTISVFVQLMITADQKAITEDQKAQMIILVDRLCQKLKRNPEIMSHVRTVDFYHLVIRDDGSAYAGAAYWFFSKPMLDVSRALSKNEKFKQALKKLLEEMPNDFDVVNAIGSAIVKVDSICGELIYLDASILINLSATGSIGLEVFRFILSLFPGIAQRISPLDFFEEHKFMPYGLLIISETGREILGALFKNNPLLFIHHVGLKHVISSMFPPPNGLEGNTSFDNQYKKGMKETADIFLGCLKHDPTLVHRVSVEDLTVKGLKDGLPYRLLSLRSALSLKRPTGRDAVLKEVAQALCNNPTLKSLLLPSAVKESAPTLNLFQLVNTTGGSKDFDPMEQKIILEGEAFCPRV